MSSNPARPVSGPPPSRRETSDWPWSLRASSLLRAVCLGTRSEAEWDMANAVGHQAELALQRSLMPAACVPPPGGTGLQRAETRGVLAWSSEAASTAEWVRVGTWSLRKVPEWTPELACSPRGHHDWTARLIHKESQRAKQAEPQARPRTEARQRSADATRLPPHPRGGGGCQRIQRFR